MAGDNQKTQTSSEEVAAANIDSSAASVSAAASASTDGVQEPATQATTSSQRTAKEWADLEAAHIKLTGPPGFHFNRMIERIEAKALKDEEGRQYSGDTDDEDVIIFSAKAEEVEEEEKEEKEEEEDEDGDDGQDEEELTQEEIQAIHQVAAHPSGRLGPLPGTIGAEVYESDTDDDDYIPDSTASNASSNEGDGEADDEGDDLSTDDEILDIELPKGSDVN